MATRRVARIAPVTDRHRILALVILVLFSVLPLQTAAASGALSGGAVLRSHTDDSGAWHWQAKLPGAGMGMELECRHSGTCAWSQLRRHSSPPIRPRACAPESQNRCFVPAGRAHRPAAADAEPA